VYDNAAPYTDTDLNGVKNMVNPETVEEKTPVEEKEEKRGRRPSTTTIFPRTTLKKALEVAKAIERENAGDPFDPILLATKALSVSHRSSAFEVLLTSSYRYGLTIGNSRAKGIELTKLGSDIVSPTDENQVSANLRKSLLTPDLFAKVYTKYDRKNIPREDILKNVLIKDFNVSREDVDNCHTILLQNIKDFTLTVQSGGNEILFLDNLGKATLSEPAQIGQDQEAGLGAEYGSVEAAPPAPKPEAEMKPLIKQIFVAHGKNKKPLEQLEKILNRFKVAYKVAVDEPHGGRPVSAKVAELMKNCTSGIFIFTADEETTDAKGNKVYRPSDNVVYELGAASVLYGNKIVIFKEENVSFASDYSDLGYISFEKDRLDSKAADLMLELINLGFMQLTPT
jgi:predicted nucleotide-binding protein